MCEGLGLWDGPHGRADCPHCEGMGEIELFDWTPPPGGVQSPASYEMTLEEAERLLAPDIDPEDDIPW